MTPTKPALLAVAVLLTPMLAAGAEDGTASAVEQISGAVLQGAKSHVTTFKDWLEPARPTRRGLEFIQGDVTIKNIPRRDGNRFIEVRIPAAERNSNGEVPQLVISAERRDLQTSKPSIFVQVPTGRRGDWVLNYEVSPSGTKYLLGRTPLSAQEAGELLKESRFTPRGQLPPEALHVISALRGVKGAPALDVANGFLRSVPAPQQRARPAIKGR